MIFKKQQTSSASKVLTGTVAGAAVGAIAGMLFAPKKGKELRNDIKESVESIPSEIKSLVSKPAQRTRRVIGKRKRSSSR